MFIQGLVPSVPPFIALAGITNVDMEIVAVKKIELIRFIILSLPY
ncbi:hypothetical protein [Bacillus sp. FJAT-29790]|nr:hypothetical protein [Bacillus sp. FJAT-29790]